MIFSEVNNLKQNLNNSSDVVIREILCGGKNINIIFLKSVVDEEYFINGILSPIMEFGIKLNESMQKGEAAKLSIDILEAEILKAIRVEKISKEEALSNISKSKVLLFLEDADEILSIDIKKVPIRMPSEPPTASVLKGPREGFVEDFDSNISLLRKRFSGDKLTIQEMKIGRYSQTTVAIVYLDEIADIKIVKKIKRRLEKIDIDGIVDSFYLIGFLQEKKNSMFKQIGNAEKPDVVAAKMLEGRVAIVVDNTPMVLTIPFIFLEDLQSSNDYYSLHYYAFYIRIIRLIGMFIAIAVPGTYLSLRIYHYNVVPIDFLMTIGNSSETIPLTPFLELLFILVLFEILYEVSLRLPRYLGLATSIVGALILGDTGVKAGLISPPGVMIIALSVISIYTIPDQLDQINLLRMLFLFIGAGLGLFGIFAGIIFIIAYLNQMDSYGVAYLAPFSPMIKPDMKDALMKDHVTKMKTRPKSLKAKNKVRLRYGKND